MHLRHFDDASNGTALLQPVEAALRRAAAGARRCALLLATDRRRTLRLMEAVSSRTGCRLLSSARGAPVTDYSAEHGEDTGEVLPPIGFLP